jgi:hypothetical protein
LIQAKVTQMWQKLSPRQRKEIRRCSERSSCGVMRCRYKIILSLVSLVGWLASSTGGRTMARTRSPIPYGMELLHLIDGSPQEHGYRRPTWTQELLILVLGERTGIRISVTTMCRLLRRLGIRLNRSKPTVGCPWPKSRRTKRLQAIRRLIDNLSLGEVVLYLDEVDIQINPKTGPNWTLAGKQNYVRTPGCNEKRYLAG